MLGLKFYFPIHSYLEFSVIGNANLYSIDQVGALVFSLDGLWREFSLVIYPGYCSAGFIEVSASVVREDGNLLI